MLMQMFMDHDQALSSPTSVDVLSARPRADLEREVRSMILAARARDRCTTTNSESERPR
jgi:hypothetical protein